MTQTGYLRIGELSRRTGVSPELLRAWERRYGLFEPERSPGRFRLYSDADLARVQAMQAHIAEGLSAAEAARLVLSAPTVRPVPESVGPALDEPLGELRQALSSFDEPGAHAAIDTLLASVSVEAFLREAVLPILRDLGERWESGESSIAEEHFTSNVLRGRLLALGRGWGRGGGPHALLAAPPGELHDLGLVVFGLALRDQGWRITLLGSDTPVETVEETARSTDPDLIVLATLMPSRLGSQADAIRRLAEGWRVLICGDGATPELAASLGVEYAAADPVDAASSLTPVRVAG